MARLGRHPHKALTARSVSAKANPGRYADGGGLYLLVAPGGSKSWVLRTTVNGKRRDIGLGGATLVSLQDARESAHQLRKLARTGSDPLLARKEARRVVPTFEEAARQVHSEHSGSFKNAKHSRQWISSLNNVFETFGPKRVDDITSADVLDSLKAGWLTRPETSRRVLQRVRVIFDWCKAQGLRSGSNPTDGVKKVLPKHKLSRTHHAALPYRELPRFLQELHDSDASETVKLAFEFTILCGSRTSETLNATWREIDLEEATWTIPATRMKAGIEHRVPLTSRVVTLLKRARSLAANSDYLFPGRQENRPLSNMVFLMALRRMGRPELTAHGFRSTFRDWAAELTNAPRAVCEAALAHVVRDKTEAAYNRSDLFDRRRDLMTAWSQFAKGSTAKVIKIRASR